MSAKKPIDLVPLEDDEISFDTSKELPKFVELTKTTEEIAKQLKHNQSSSLIEPNEEEYQFVDKEGPWTSNILLKYPTIIRAFNPAEPYDLQQDLCRTRANISFGQLVQVAPTIKKPT